MPTRRQTTIGLLSAALGSAAVSSGSFLSETTSAADLRVLVVSALTLTPARPDAEYVTTDADGEVKSIEITLDGNETDDAEATGLNQNAVTTFDELVTITNNGDATYDRIEFEFIEGTDGLEASVAETLRVISDDVPTETDEQGQTTLLANDDETLGPGDAVTFGVMVNLIASSSPGDRDDLPDASEVALEITAIPE